MEWVKKRTDIQSADSKVGWTRIKFDVTSYRRRKARRKGLRQCRVRGRVNSKKKGDGVQVR